jgi:AcrR family transcriptional regulator
MEGKAQVPGGQGPQEQEPPGQESPGQTSGQGQAAEQGQAVQRRRTVRSGTIRAQARRAEHAADTREALVDAARRLFARDGFDDTGTEQIVAEARVTRGALYHHFRDKADLFRAVMAQAAGDVAQRLIDEQLAAEATSPLDDIRDGVSAFLDVCIGGDFQRIVLVDGPRVLGADAWEDLVDRYGRAILEEWLGRAAETGALDAMPVRGLARLLIAMLTEASLAIARADDPAAERADLGVVLDRMLTGLRPRLG